MYGIEHMSNVWFDSIKYVCESFISRAHAVREWSLRHTLHELVTVFEKTDALTKKEARISGRSLVGASFRCFIIFGRSLVCEKRVESSFLFLSFALCWLSFSDPARYIFRPNFHWGLLSLSLMVSCEGLSWKYTRSQ